MASNSSVAAPQSLVIACQIPHLGDDNSPSRRL